MTTTHTTQRITFQVNNKIRDFLNKGKEKLRRRLCRKTYEDQKHPLFRGSNIRYSVTEKEGTIGYGGIGAMHSLVRRLKLDRLSNQVRFFFYLTNDRRMTAAEVVFFANDRCDQENLMAQLKTGVHELKMPAADSDETGRSEVCITSMSNPGKGTPITSGGGVSPLWAPDGRTIYYWDPDFNRLMAMEIAAGTSISVGKPHQLFEFPTVYVNYIRHYDISPDGSRFLIPSRSETRPLEVTHLNPVQNWFEELKRLVPTRKN